MSFIVAVERSKIFGPGRQLIRIVLKETIIFILSSSTGSNEKSLNTHIFDDLMIVTAHKSILGRLDAHPLEELMGVPDFASNGKDKGK